MTGLPNIAVRHHVATFVGCLLIAFVPGAIGSAFPPDAWYEAIEKAPLTPPGWVFPVAWTALYLMIGISLYAFLIHAPDRGRRAALVLFGTQLVLNAAWSWLFFGLHAPVVALIEIIAMWLAIAGTILAFRRHSRLAAGLLVPYLAWVSFATYLTAYVCYAN